VRLQFGACDRRDALLIESENAERQFASLLPPLHPTAHKHSTKCISAQSFWTNSKVDTLGSGVSIFKFTHFEINSYVVIKIKSI